MLKKNPTDSEGCFAGILNQFDKLMQTLSYLSFERIIVLENKYCLAYIVNFESEIIKIVLQFIIKDLHLDGIYSFCVKIEVPQWPSGELNSIYYLWQQVLKTP